MVSREGGAETDLDGCRCNLLLGGRDSVLREGEEVCDGCGSEVGAGVGVLVLEEPKTRLKNPGFSFGCACADVGSSFALL